MKGQLPLFYWFWEVELLACGGAKFLLLLLLCLCFFWWFEKMFHVWCFLKLFFCYVDLLLLWFDLFVGVYNLFLCFISLFMLFNMFCYFDRTLCLFRYGIQRCLVFRELITYSVELVICLQMFPCSSRFSCFFFV